MNNHERIQAPSLLEARALVNESLIRLLNDRYDGDFKLLFKETYEQVNPSVFEFFKALSSAFAANEESEAAYETCREVFHFSRDLGYNIERLSSGWQLHAIPFELTDPLQETAANKLYTDAVQFFEARPVTYRYVAENIDTHSPLAITTAGLALQRIEERMQGDIEYEANTTVSQLSPGWENEVFW